MNKFNKTSYSRPQNFNAISSSQGRRNPIAVQQSEWFNSNNNDHLLQGKIDIESSLLITHKNYQRQTSKPVQSQIAKQFQKKQGKLYETTTGFMYGRERPMSKQEPRNRGTAEGKDKGNSVFPERPQTSKGVRHFRQNVRQCGQHKISEGDEQLMFPVKLTEKKPRAVQSSSNKRNSQNTMSFQTSIDPQFLSLFAN